MASTKNATGTLTAAEVRTLLRTAAERLGAREEKVLRMRQGLTFDREAPLPRRGMDHPEAHADLLALEWELTRRMAAKAAAKAPPKAAAKAAPKVAPPVRTKEKDKIIRALRRLK